MAQGSKMPLERYHLSQDVMFKTWWNHVNLLVSPFWCKCYIKSHNPVYAEHIYGRVYPLCVFLSLWDVCGSPEDDFTVQLYVAPGVISSNVWISQGAFFNTLWSLWPKNNFSQTCNFAHHQIWADRLWERKHVCGAKCSGIIDYSCCSLWVLLILMCQMWPQTVNRCLAVNDTINNLFVDPVYTLQF